MDKRLLARYLEVSKELENKIDEAYCCVNHCRFAFKNKTIIKYLTQRGNYLKNAKFAKAKQVELKIDAYKNANYEELVSPVHAFVVFEYEAARNLALSKPFRNAFSFRGAQL